MGKGRPSLRIATGQGFCSRPRPVGPRPATAHTFLRLKVIPASRLLVNRASAAEACWRWRRMLCSSSSPRTAFSRASQSSRSMPALSCPPAAHTDGSVRAPLPNSSRTPCLYCRQEYTDLHSVLPQDHSPVSYAQGLHKATSRWSSFSRAPGSDTSVPCAPTGRCQSSCIRPLTCLLRQSCPAPLACRSPQHCPQTH